MIQCQWCQAQNQPGSTSCQTCGAPLDERNKVSDSGWREAPRLRDMLSFAAYILQPNSQVPLLGASVQETINDFGLYAGMAKINPTLLYVLTHGAQGTRPSVRRRATSSFGKVAVQSATMPSTSSILATRC